MICGLCKEGLLDEALALLSKMEDIHCLHDAVSFEIIIQSLLGNNENDRVEMLLHEMIERTIRIIKTRWGAIEVTQVLMFTL